MMKIIPPFLSPSYKIIKDLLIPQPSNLVTFSIFLMSTASDSAGHCFLLKCPFLLLTQGAALWLLLFSLEELGFFFPLVQLHGMVPQGTVLAIFVFVSLVTASCMLSRCPLQPSVLQALVLNFQLLLRHFLLKIPQTKLTSTRFTFPPAKSFHHFLNFVNYTLILHPPRGQRPLPPWLLPLFHCHIL